MTFILLLILIALVFGSGLVVKILWVLLAFFVIAVVLGLSVAAIAGIILGRDRIEQHAQAQRAQRTYDRALAGEYERVRPWTDSDMSSLTIPTTETAQEALNRLERLRLTLENETNQQERQRLQVEFLRMLEKN